MPHTDYSYLVSIIMPSYNCESFIKASIKSVIAQEYENWELLISDDCSNDDTLKIIKSYCDKDIRISMITSNTNLGPAVSRNKAIEKAKGRFIAFLDSDDLWSPQKLSKQIPFMVKNKIALCYTRYNSIDAKGELIKQAPALPLKIDYNGLLKNQVIGCLTAVYDTELCGKVFMPIIDKRQDFGLWLKILKQGQTAYLLNEVVAKYRIRQNSVSSNKFVAIYFTWKLFREVENLPFLKSFYCLINCIFNRLKRQ